MVNKNTYNIGWHYLSNATLSNAASFVLCVFCRVKDHHKLLHYSPRLKNICIRQVMLDKWFPVMMIIIMTMIMAMITIMIM